MIATIAAITEKKKSSAIAAIIEIILTEPLSSDRPCCDRWKVVSLWSLSSLRSLHFFFSAIAAITALVAIIWEPGLSYASLLNKIRFNNYNTLYYVSCCSLIHVFFFRRNEKGLLNFASGRIKLVYRINNTRYNFQKNKLPFKHLKPHVIGRILLSWSPYLNINYCFIGRDLKIYDLLYNLCRTKRDWER